MFRLDLQPSSPVPLYRQIVEQVERALIAGVLLDGAEIPSVRSVADEHAINPMTVSKAYSLLEMRGLLERRKGVGMFAIAPKLTGQGAKNTLFPYLEQTAVVAQQMRVSEDEAVSWFRDVYAGLAKKKGGRS